MLALDAPAITFTAIVGLDVVSFGAARVVVVSRPVGHFHRVPRSDLRHDRFLPPPLRGVLLTTSVYDIPLRRIRLRGAVVKEPEGHTVPELRWLDRSRGIEHRHDGLGETGRSPQRESRARVRKLKRVFRNEPRRRKRRGRFVIWVLPPLELFPNHPLHSFERDLSNTGSPRRSE